MASISRLLPALAACALAAGCATTEAPSGKAAPEEQLASIAHLLPPGGAVAGWRMDGEVREFPGRKLFDFIDGAGEIHMTYNFVTAATADYVDKSDRCISVSVFQVATAADAYGLNSYYSPARGKRVSVGHDGRLLLGTCRFWKGPYYVAVDGDPVEELDPAAEAFARLVAERVAEDGEPPAVVAVLPAEGRRTDPVVFLHKPLILFGLSFRAVVVDPEALGLNEKTSMAVAEYEGDFALSVTRYPDEEAMRSARDAYVNARAYVTNVGPYWVATTSKSPQAERAFQAAVRRLWATPGRQD